MAGGVTYLREKFFEEVAKFMDSNTQLDKKTVRGDIDRMVQSGKLCVQTYQLNDRQVVFLPGTSEETIFDYVVKEKDSKKTTFGDIIQNTDLYFFDQTEKTRFHRGAKSAERIRKYQKKPLVTLSNPRIKQKSGSISTTNKEGKKKERSTKINASKKKESSKNKSNPENARPDFHLGNKTGVLALIMCVVITKSMTNEIRWDKISSLYPNNSLDSLKKQWTVRRVRMGHVGWKARIDEWKMVLLSAIKEGSISLEEAEQLDIMRLLNLWRKFQSGKQHREISLFKNYADNKKHFNFIKDDEKSIFVGRLAMSSMVQREIASLKMVFKYSTSHQTTEEVQHHTLEEKIKTVIRSILIDNRETAKDTIEALQDVSKDEIDKVVMDMAKEKQVYLRGSKLEATNAISEHLNHNEVNSSFERSSAYIKKLMEMFTANNGLIVNNEISDATSWVLIDLIARKAIDIGIIPLQRDIHRLAYTTRRFEVSTLTPPLILYSNLGSTKLPLEKDAPIPAGKPYSRLWLDSVGNIRTSVWYRLTCMIIFEILFSPGINLQCLQKRCHNIVSLKELLEICSWLKEKEILGTTPYEGFKVVSRWYTF